jgi:dolichyl-phosphate beta-glucosyltransferase
MTIDASQRALHRWTENSQNANGEVPMPSLEHQREGRMEERQRADDERRTLLGLKEDAPPETAELDLVIPVFNEEGRIGATLAAITDWATGQGESLRILVVDNGCVDATAEVVAGVRQPGVPVEIISCRTRGKGAAVRAGIAWSTAPYVGYIDADLSTPPSAITSGMDLLRSGWEVVIGSRRCAGAGYVSPQGSVRRLGSFAFRLLASDLRGPITDTQCGCKLFHSPVAKDLFSSSRLTGFAFDVEVLAHARRRDLRMIELPIRWSDNEGSTFRPLTDGVRSLRELREARRSVASVSSPGPVDW